MTKKTLCDIILFFVLYGYSSLQLQRHTSKPLPSDIDSAYIQVWFQVGESRRSEIEVGKIAVRATIRDRHHRAPVLV